jgi:hypothetical protein
MSKFSFFFFFGFSNLTNKIVTGIAYTWGLLIANHLDESLWSTNQKYWTAVTSNLVHSFLEVQNCVAPFPSQSQLHEYQFPEQNRHILTFFAINLTVWSHILSTGGDAALIARFGYIFPKDDQAIFSTSWFFIWMIAN